MFYGNDQRKRGKNLPLNNSFNFNSEHGIDLRQKNTLARKLLVLRFQLGLNQEAEINNGTINNFYHEQINL